MKQEENKDREGLDDFLRKGPADGDAFEKDAWEGLSSLQPGEAKKMMESLDDRLTEKLQENKRTSGWIYWMAAALVLGFGLLVFRWMDFSSSSNRVAVVQPKAHNVPPPVAPPVATPATLPATPSLAPVQKLEKSKSESAKRSIEPTPSSRNSAVVMHEKEITAAPALAEADVSEEQPAMVPDRSPESRKKAVVRPFSDSVAVNNWSARSAARMDKAAYASAPSAAGAVAVPLCIYEKGSEVLQNEIRHQLDSLKISADFSALLTISKNGKVKDISWPNGKPSDSKKIKIVLMKLGPFDCNQGEGEYRLDFKKSAGQ